MSMPPTTIARVEKCNISRIGAGARQEQHVKIASVTSKPSFENAPVTGVEEGAVQQVSILETVVVAVDPTTGLAPEFANALKLCRSVPGTAFIPESKPLLGYRTPPNRLEVPASWAVVLIEEPPPIVACYTQSILSLGRDEPSFGVTFSPNIKEYLIDPTFSVFWDLPGWWYLRWRHFCSSVSIFRQRGGH